MNAVHTPFAVDQLRANAKAHKKQIDRLAARLGQVTQQLMVKEQEAAFYKATLEQHLATRQPAPSVIIALVPLVIGFAALAGGVAAYALAKFMGVL